MSNLSVDIVNEYHKNHAYCPKCGSKNKTIKEMAEHLNTDLGNYRDDNTYECKDCGDKHLGNDRISLLRKRQIRLNRRY